MKENTDMKKDRLIYLCTIWIIFGLFAIPLLMGCGENSQTGKTSITVPINLSPMQANITAPDRHLTTMAIRIVKVEYDEEIIQESFDISPDDFPEGKKIMVFEDIPMEEDLLIEVFIFDQEGRLFFEGMEGINIPWDETGEVVIHMEHRPIIMDGPDGFMDDFEDGNADGWEPISGEWDVKLVNDNHEYQYRSVGLTNAAGRLSTIGEDFWTDYAVEARVRYREKRDGAGIAGRIQDENNFYLFIIEKSGNHQLVKVVDQKRIPLGIVSRPIDPIEFSIGRLEFEGPILRAFLNGELLMEVHDDEFGNGRIGLWALHGAPVSFDDVHVSFYF